MGIRTKEARAEMETHPVIVELQSVSDKYNSKLYKFFDGSYSLIHFDLFLRLNNLFDIFFPV